MKKYRAVFLLLIFFCVLFSLSETAVATARDKLASALPDKSSPLAPSAEVENQLLKLGIARLKEWIAWEKEMEGEISLVQELYWQAPDPFFERRSRHLAAIIDRQLHSLPAKVILHEPMSFHAMVWLNVGERDNEALGHPVVAVGSPVISGKRVVGVVERVAKTRSFVRLITDPALRVAVRVARGGSQNQALLADCNRLCAQLAARDDLENAARLADALRAFCRQIDPAGEGVCLAKGLLCGASRPLWRSMGQTLRGEGFQYAFADEEGPARDLREGPPLICVGDLLVTTGLDGVFPPDLHAAVVTKIYPLGEGECAYRLEALSLAPSLDELGEVTVLSPS